MVHYEAVTQGHDHRRRAIQNRRLSFYLADESHLASLRRRLPRDFNFALSRLRPSQRAHRHSRRHAIFLTRRRARWSLVRLPLQFLHRTQLTPATKGKPRLREPGAIVSGCALGIADGTFTEAGGDCICHHVADCRDSTLRIERGEISVARGFRVTRNKRCEPIACSAISRKSIWKKNHFARLAVNYRKKSRIYFIHSSAFSIVAASRATARRQP